ncbi:MAG TPA: MBL fold metallo-hydrolase [Thermoanaerobaculia bacterium]|nr:MBL fold metallo-hydrolase [Thermoanaerobaculia bacterium]
MRLYGQGLGDCFLLAFPRIGDPQNKNPVYLVIDCGVAMSTPQKDVRIKQVVENIRAATGGHIDALAVTHQHFDHISGFQDAWQEWKSVTVDAVYLPWTEAVAATGEHSGTTAFRKVLDQAAKKAMEKAVDMGMLDAHPGFRAQADFLGVDLEAVGGAGGKVKGPANMDEAMAFARGLCPPDKIRFFEPGDVFRLPGTQSNAYVLGPPLPDNARSDGKKYIELLVDGTDGVMYSYDSLGLKVDAGKPGGDNAFALSDDRGLPAMASALLAADTFGRQSDEGFCPFAPEIRLDWDNSMASPFFQDHYGETETGEDGAWRRVDTDWLAGAASLALRAGDFTNNVSLVLAFDVPNSSKMLLFPGDAQVGNWLSWHTLREWHFLDGLVPANPPAANDKQTLMENLLSRVVFYKVGHHASHNATIKDQGLEKMHDDLVAFIPVSVPVAQDLMGYCPMPFYPVVRALQRKTKGRVFLPNGQAVGPLPNGVTNANLLAQAGIVCAEETLPEMRDKAGRLLQGEGPLYLEVTVVP